MKNIELNILNLHCNGCKNLIERTCLELEGVGFCEVLLESNTAIVSGSDFDESLLLNTINGLGKYIASIKNPK